MRYHSRVLPVRERGRLVGWRARVLCGPVTVYGHTFRNRAAAVAWAEREVAWCRQESRAGREVTA